MHFISAHRETEFRAAAERIEAVEGSLVFFLHNLSRRILKISKLYDCQHIFPQSISNVS